MRIVKRRLAIGVTAALGLVLVGGGAAIADTTAHSFDETVPAFQQSHYMSSYGRSSSTAASKIKFTAIGSNYLMNVKAQNLQTNTQYTEVKGINDDSAYHNIPNSTPSGQQSRLIVTNYDYAAVSVEIQGAQVIN